MKFADTCLWASRTALRNGVLAIALSCLSMGGSGAQDLPVKTPLPANACKTPSTRLTAPGFTLACGKQIRSGIFLGAFLSPAADSLGDCVARCLANDKCLAFSLDNRDSTISRVCTLFGSTEGSAEAKDWILGIRISQQRVLPKTLPSKTGISYDTSTNWLIDTASETTTLALGPTSDPIPGGTNSYIRNTIGKGTLDGSLGNYSASYPTIFPTKPFPGITGKPDLTGTGAWANIANSFNPKDIKATDGPLTPTPDMKSLQPVYFATDRTRLAGPLQEASFTDTPIKDLTYGYAMVSIPKSHVIGDVERPQWRWLKFSTETESDADHFRIKTLNALSREDFAKQLRGDADSVLLFVHGYNVTFSDAIYKAAQIAFDANFAGAVLAFSWPSAGDPLKYDKDRESAESAAPRLAQVFKLIMEDIGKKNVYIVAHSMGNQVLVDALQQAALSKAKINISELVMAAPDVAKSVFESKADDIRAVAKNITMYASSADKALRASGVKSFGTRLGFVGETGPNIYPGIETIDVTAVGDDMFGLNHGTFSNSRAVLDDLGHLMRSLAHLPPDARTPTLKFMPDKARVQYWLYPR